MSPEYIDPEQNNGGVGGGFHKKLAGRVYNYRVLFFMLSILSVAPGASLGLIFGMPEQMCFAGDEDNKGAFPEEDPDATVLQLSIYKDDELSVLNQDKTKRGLHKSMKELFGKLIAFKKAHKSRVPKKYRELCKKYWRYVMSKGNPHQYQEFLQYFKNFKFEKSNNLGEDGDKPAKKTKRRSNLLEGMLDQIKRTESRLTFLDRTAKKKKAGLSPKVESEDSDSDASDSEVLDDEKEHKTSSGSSYKTLLSVDLFQRLKTHKFKDRFGNYQGFSTPEFAGLMRELAGELMQFEADEGKYVPKEFAKLINEYVDILGQNPKMDLVAINSKIGPLFDSLRSSLATKSSAPGGLYTVNAEGELEFNVSKRTDIKDDEVGGRAKTWADIIAKFPEADEEAKEEKKGEQKADARVILLPGTLLERLKKFEYRSFLRQYDNLSSPEFYRLMSDLTAALMGFEANTNKQIPKVFDDLVEAYDHGLSDPRRLNSLVGPALDKLKEALPQGWAQPKGHYNIPRNGDLTYEGSGVNSLKPITDDRKPIWDTRLKGLASGHPKKEPKGPKSPKAAKENWKQFLDDAAIQEILGIHGISDYQTFLRHLTNICRKVADFAKTKGGAPKQFLQLCTAAAEYARKQGEEGSAEAIGEALEDVQEILADVYTYSRPHDALVDKWDGDLARKNKTYFEVNLNSSDVTKGVDLTQDLRALQAELARLGGGEKKAPEEEKKEAGSGGGKSSDKKLVIHQYGKLVDTAVLELFSKIDVKVEDLNTPDGRKKIGSMRGVLEDFCKQMETFERTPIHSQKWKVPEKFHTVCEKAKHFFNPRNDASLRPLLQVIKEVQELITNLPAKGEEKEGALYRKTDRGIEVTPHNADTPLVEIESGLLNKFSFRNKRWDGIFAALSTAKPVWPVPKEELKKPEKWQQFLTDSEIESIIGVDTTVNKSSYQRTLTLLAHACKGIARFANANGSAPKQFVDLCTAAAEYAKKKVGSDVALVTAVKKAQEILNDVFVNETPHSLLDDWDEHLAKKHDGEFKVNLGSSDVIKPKTDLSKVLAILQRELDRLNPDEDGEEKKATPSSGGGAHSGGGSSDGIVRYGKLLDLDVAKEFLAIDTGVDYSTGEGHLKLGHVRGVLEEFCKQMKTFEKTAVHGRKWQVPEKFRTVCENAKTYFRYANDKTLGSLMQAIENARGILYGIPSPGDKKEGDLYIVASDGIRITPNRPDSGMAEIKSGFLDKLSWKNKRWDEILEALSSAKALWRAPPAGEVSSSISSSKRRSSQSSSTSMSDEKGEEDGDEGDTADRRHRSSLSSIFNSGPNLNPPPPPPKGDKQKASRPESSSDTGSGSSGSGESRLTRFFGYLRSLMPKRPVFGSRPTSPEFTLVPKTEPQSSNNTSGSGRSWSIWPSSNKGLAGNESSSSSSPFAFNLFSAFRRNNNASSSSSSSSNSADNPKTQANNPVAQERAKLDRTIASLRAEDTIGIFGRIKHSVNIFGEGKEKRTLAKWKGEAKKGDNEELETELEGIVGVAGARDQVRYKARVLSSKIKSAQITALDRIARNVAAPGSQVRADEKRLADTFTSAEKEYEKTLKKTLKKSGKEASDLHRVDTALAAKVVSDMGTGSPHYVEALLSGDDSEIYSKYSGHAAKEFRQVASGDKDDFEKQVAYCAGVHQAMEGMNLNDPNLTSSFKKLKQGYDNLLLGCYETAFAIAVDDGELGKFAYHVQSHEFDPKIKAKLAEKLPVLLKADNRAKKVFGIPVAIAKEDLNQRYLEVLELHGKLKKKGIKVTECNDGRNATRPLDRRNSDTIRDTSDILSSSSNASGGSGAPRRPSQSSGSGSGTPSSSSSASGGGSGTTTNTGSPPDDTKTPPQDDFDPDL